MLYRKSLTAFVCMCLALFVLASCGKKNDDNPKSDVVAQGDDAVKSDAKADAKADSGNAGLKDGKWPAAVYSKYGIDEISTKGKIVYTEFSEDGPYRYQVDYHGVTQDELKAWVDQLIAKGLRIHDRDKERLNGKYDHDTMIYFADEKQPYRMRLSYDFNQDMEFEYYVDPDKHNPAFTITERGEGDDASFFIVYNLSISLNPIKNEQEFKGSIDSLGLKAEDLKLNDNVRSVSMSEGPNGANLAIRFYADHMTTKEEFDGCRDLLMDKLAEKGAKFAHAMSGKEMTAAELKEAGIGSYSVEKDGKKFMLLVDPDSEFNEFGGKYGVRLMLKK